MGRTATSRGGSDKGTTTAPTTPTRRSDNGIGNVGKATKSDRTTTLGTGSTIGSMDRQNGNRPNGNRGGNGKPDGNKGGNGGMDKPNGNKGGNGGMDKPNGNRGGHDGKDKPNGNKGGNGKPDGNRHNDRNGNHHGDNGKHGGNRGYNPNHRYDYGSHHYRDEFSWNHSHHNWSRPLPPPVRAHRPAPLVWMRPVIPVGWHPYAGAPIIDRILGLMFGSLYEASLDHLYFNGYYIDGYADNIIYLRDVSMLNLYWPDVMLNYEYGKLANAQFIYHSSYYDRARFDRVYNSLCRIYGSPVFQDGMTISWYGGNNTGWVTLTMTDSYGDYYTTMSIGY